MDKLESWDGYGYRWDFQDRYGAHECTLTPVCIHMHTVCSTRWSCDCTVPISKSWDFQEGIVHIRPHKQQSAISAYTHCLLHQVIMWLYRANNISKRSCDCTVQDIVVLWQLGQPTCTMLQNSQCYTARPYVLLARQPVPWKTLGHCAVIPNPGQPALCLVLGFCGNLWCGTVVQPDIGSAVRALVRFNHVSTCSVLTETSGSQCPTLHFHPYYVFWNAFVVIHALAMSLDKCHCTTQQIICNAYNMPVYSQYIRPKETYVPRCKVPRYIYRRSHIQ